MPVETHELDLVGGAVRVHAHDHTDVTRFEAERRQGTRENDLGMLLKHCVLRQRANRGG
jgi:hypothetical protein